MKVTLDIETRSRIGLSGGVWKYAHHPTTQILMVAYKIDDEPTQLVWTGAIPKMMRFNPIKWSELLNIIAKADEIICHNAEFEYACFSSTYHEKHDSIKRHQLTCTMAMAGMHGLPLSLEKAGEAVQLPIQKDKQGSLLMKRICTPDKEGNFDEQEDVLLRVGDYCKRDVDTTYALYTYLDKMLPKERLVYQATVNVNRRGCKLDRQLIEQVVKKYTENKARLLTEFRDLTGVDSPSCRNSFLAWLNSKGLELSNITAPLVASTLERDDISDDVRKSLELRQELSRTSLRKYSTMLDCIQADDRARGMFCYHAATTGRWGGRGIQPHNLPRGTIKDTDQAATVLRHPELSIDSISMLYGERAFTKVASSCVRSAFIGTPFLSCADWSAIEARVIAWLAGEETVLRAFRLKKDPYITAASGIYNVPEGKVTEAQRSVGKVSVLACGYQGWIGAFSVMAAAFDVDISEDEAMRVVKAWRENNPNIVRWWKQLEDAAIQAISNPNTAVLARSVLFKMNGIFLTVTLPSGRKLYYPYATIKPKRTPWGEERDSVYYMTVKTGVWQEVDTYGGKLAENITQAVARDLLAEVIINLQDHIVLHIHDEIVTEGDMLDKLIDTMLVVPSWAEGLPLAAAGWVEKRYRKD